MSSTGAKKINAQVPPSKLPKARSAEEAAEEEAAATAATRWRTSGNHSLLTFVGSFGRAVGRSGFVTEDPNFVPVTRITILFGGIVGSPYSRGRPFTRNMSLNSDGDGGDDKKVRRRSSLQPPSKPCPWTPSSFRNRFL